MSTGDRMLRLSEVVERTSLSRRTIERAISARRLRVIRPTGPRGLRLVREADLNAWIAGEPAGQRQQ